MFFDTFVTTTILQWTHPHTESSKPKSRGFSINIGITLPPCGNVCYCINLSYFLFFSCISLNVTMTKPSNHNLP